MERLTERINGVVVYTQGKYTYTTAGEMTGDDVRKVLAKLCEYEDKEHMTNADRIRNMSDEELADLITNIHQEDIDEYEYVYIVEGNSLEEYKDILQWLQAEVKEGDSDAEP